MSPHRIAVIPGDGIGKEVVPEGLRALRAAAEKTGVELGFTELLWDCDYYLEHGRMMPEDGVQQLREFDAIYLGGIGDPAKAPEDVSNRGIVLTVRRELEQFANVRPVRPLPGALFPLAHVRPEQIDFVVVREATEGFYIGEGGRYRRGTAEHERWRQRRKVFADSEEIALQIGVFSTEGARRVMRYSFDLARGRAGAKRVTNCTKSNALGFGFGLWDDVFQQVAAKYPDVETETLYVDALAMKIVQEPERFDVIVAPNLFGDIITDLTAALLGGLGLAPGANIAPGGVSMFEPPHGTAPDIAGQQKANPIAAILTGALMLRELGEERAAQLVEEAAAEVVAAGHVRTPDMGGAHTTADLGQAIAEAIRRA